MNKIKISKNDTNVEIQQDGIYDIDGYNYTVTVDSENGKVTVSRLCDSAIITVIEDEKISILKKSDELTVSNDKTIPPISDSYKVIGDVFDWSNKEPYGSGKLITYNLKNNCIKCVKNEDAKKVQFFDIAIEDCLNSEIIEKFIYMFNFHYDTLQNENLEIGATRIYSNYFKGFFAYYMQGYRTDSEKYGKDNHKNFTLYTTDEFSGNLQGRLLDEVVKKGNLTDFALYFKKPTSYFNSKRIENNLPSSTHGLLDVLNPSSLKAKSIVVEVKDDFSAGVQCVLLSKYYTNSNTFHFNFEDSFYFHNKYIDIIIDIDDNREATLKIDAKDYYDGFGVIIYDDDMLNDVETVCKAIALMNDDSDYENVFYIDEDGNEVNLDLYYSKFLLENRILENGLMYSKTPILI